MENFKINNAKKTPNEYVLIQTKMMNLMRFSEQSEIQM